MPDPQLHLEASHTMFSAVVDDRRVRQWFALASLIVLVPLTGGFLVLDSRLFCRWRSGILEMAHLRRLDVEMFRKTISGFRQLPPNSLQAMLSALPANRREAARKLARCSRRFETRIGLERRRICEGYCVE